MKVGDVMVAREGVHSGYLVCGSGWYTHAILVSVEPFVMVSQEGDMMWSCADSNNYVALCEASPKARRKAFERFARENAKANAANGSEQR
jgi:hypothetical protein